MFGPLRLAIAALDEFEEYRTRTYAEPEWAEFEHIDLPSVAPTNVTSIAKVNPSGQKLVIKFVEKYGAEARELLAREGVTPRLLYCGLLDGKRDFRHVGSDFRGSI